MSALTLLGGCLAIAAYAALASSRRVVAHIFGPAVIGALLVVASWAGFATWQTLELLLMLFLVATVYAGHQLYRALLSAAPVGDRR